MIHQQETETIHVSCLQLLFFSQTFRLGLLVELRTGGVERPDDMLADAPDFEFLVPLKLLSFASLSKFLLWFSSASPVKLLIPFKQRNLMRRPRLLC